TVEVGGEGAGPSRRGPGQPRARGRRPGVGDRRGRSGLRSGGGFPGHDVESPRERPRGPAAADDAGADYGQLLGLGGPHETAAGRAVLRRSLVRASAGVRARAPSNSMIWIAFSTSWPLLANTPFLR